MTRMTDSSKLKIPESSIKPGLNERTKIVFRLSTHRSAIPVSDAHNVNKNPRRFRDRVARIFGRSSRVCTLDNGGRDAGRFRDSEGRVPPCRAGLARFRNLGFGRFRVSDLLGTLREPRTVYRYARNRGDGALARRAWLFTPVKPCPRDDTTLLWSAQLSCVQMSGFRVRDGLARSL